MSIAATSSPRAKGAPAITTRRIEAAYVPSRTLTRALASTAVLRGIWIGGGVPIFWEFAMEDDHHINRERIEHLLQSASSAGGLFVSRQLLPAP
jgi:hypothetical protein